MGEPSYKDVYASVVRERETTTRIQQKDTHEIVDEIHGHEDALAESHHQIEAQAARIAELEAKVAEKDEALLWYWSRVSGSMGDPPHQGYAGDLLEDKGARARAALGGEAGK
ncbi:MAG: hypothetical protein AAF354_07360 [Pseudomonadota bacterium]